MFAFTLLSAFSVVLFCVYLYFKWCLLYWKKKGVRTIQTSFPFANLSPIALGKLNINDALKEYYDTFRKRGQKYGGLYFLNGPVFFPVEVQLVKDILTTNFHQFVNRGAFKSKEYLLSENVFMEEDSTWKSMRAKITPLFTTVKLKSMYKVVKLCCRDLVSVVENKEGTTFELKDLGIRFNIDVVSHLMLGLEGNALREQDSDFQHIAEKTIHHTPWEIIKTLLTSNLRDPGSLFKLLVINREVEGFFKTVVKKSKNHENNIVTQHFMKLLESGQVSDDEVAAQLFVLFTAGFETSSTALTLALYELAKNEELQEELRKEIVENVGRDIEQFDYDKLMGLPLLDKVIKETLRKYPPVTFLNRKCNSDYTIPGTKIVVEKGTPLLISLYGLHRDPAYFPNPHVFDPSRFDDESKIVPFSYIPFGEGPRICAGLRLGIVQTKAAAAAMISNFRLFVNSKTIEPIRMKVYTEVPVIHVDGGVWVNATKI